MDRNEPREAGMQEEFKYFPQGKYVVWSDIKERVHIEIGNDESTVDLIGDIYLGDFELNGNTRFIRIRVLEIENDKTFNALRLLAGVPDIYYHFKHLFEKNHSYMLYPDGAIFCETRPANMAINKGEIPHE